MTRFLGSRGAAALGGILLSLVGGSTDALAQARAITTNPALAKASAPAALVNVAPGFSLSSLPSSAKQAVNTLTTAVPAAVKSAGNAVVAAFTAPAVAVPAAMARAPLSLASLVEANKVGTALDEQAQCLATAVYFEARGEPIEGQLAVANVVMNRAKSGQYPADWCGVVKQKAQFSFVRNGQFPRANTACEAWAKAVAVARIAANNIAAELPGDVLWYHANYVAPSWGKRLTRVDTIGAHIFYRA